ncbi:MAG TPA: FAD-dependent oxidoreductase [Vicinamibacterales bacterium]|nr:FAD-dependent oxidoreductase [Vicinamibacterales bacterium]
MTSVTILGAGPAGLGAALGLARDGHDVTVLEQADRVGGNAGSFQLAGLQVDYGSHRFHPAADPDVLALVRELLGDDLLARPRHGRIRLLGRWIHFPLRPLDLALHAHPRFTAGVLGDAARKMIGARGTGAGGTETFASVLERGLGSTICREFYFPYARKIWGLEPDAISPIQAYRRVSAGSIGKLVKRLIPGAGGQGARGRKGIFYYPRHGYGQISDALRSAAERAGARIRLSTTAKRIELGTPDGHRVETTSGGAVESSTSQHIWSTIPVTTLVRLIAPSAPVDVVSAASRLDLRAMLLVYLVLGTDQFTEFDAHYFPGADLPFTRISEPKNYAALDTPRGRTVLCAEIPCNRQDAIWSKSDEELGAIVKDGLARTGLPVRCPVVDVAVRRLPAAYPIYRIGYEQNFDTVDRWVSGLSGVLSFGRQGLYAHDNTHHALFMALAAVDCLKTGRFDDAAWQHYRRIFETHVVED